MAVTNVVTNLSFTGSLDRLKAFNTGMTKAISHVTKFAIAVKGIESATRVFTTLTIGSLQPLVDLSRVTGVATERIQALEYAAIKAGGSGAEFKNSLNSIQNKISEASVSGSSDFAMLGISIRDANGQLKSADKVMFEVGRRLNNMNLSQAQQINFAARMGIDANTLKLITKSNDEVNRLTKEAGQLGLVTSNQAKKISSFNASIASLKFSLTAIKNQVAIGLAPELKELSEQFQNTIKNNKQWVTDGITQAVSGLEALGRAIKRVGEFIWDLSVSMTGSKQGAVLLLGAIALWLSPISAISLALIGIFLIVDDLIVAFKGGDSFIVANLNSIAAAALIVSGAILAIGIAISVATGTAFAPITLFIAAVALIGSAIALVWKNWDKITGFISDSIDSLTSSIKKMIDWIKNSVKSIMPDWLKSLLGIDKDGENNPSVAKTEEDKQNYQKLVYQQALTPNTTYNSSASNSSQVVNNNVEINVTGSEPQQTGAIVKDRITDELANANAQARAIGGK